jgi:hypothetical protein
MCKMLTDLVQIHFDGVVAVTHVGAFVVVAVVTLASIVSMCKMGCKCTCIDLDRMTVVRIARWNVTDHDVIVVVFAIVVVIPPIFVAVAVIVIIVILVCVVVIIPAVLVIVIVSTMRTMCVTFVAVTICVYDCG